MLKEKHLAFGIILVRCGVMSFFDKLKEKIEQKINATLDSYNDPFGLIIGYILLESFSMHREKGLALKQLVKRILEDIERCDNIEDVKNIVRKYKALLFGEEKK